MEDSQEGPFGSTDPLTLHGSSGFPEQSQWNLKFPSFGEVVDGIDVATATQKGDWIKSIRIVGDSTAVLAPYADKIEIWNAALENAKPSVETKSQESIPIPEGTRPVGF